MFAKTLLFSGAYLGLLRVGLFLSVFCIFLCSKLVLKNYLPEGRTDIFFFSLLISVLNTGSIRFIDLNTEITLLAID